MVAHLGVSGGDGVDGGVVRRLGEGDWLTRACWGGLGRRLQFRAELGTASLPVSSSGGS